jgi:hypothetical protein
MISYDEEVRVDVTHRGMSNSPDLLSQVAGHDVDALGQVLPCPRYSRYGGLSTELSVRSDFPGDTVLVSSCSRRVLGVAHRVTSDEKLLRLSTIPLTVCFMSRISPNAST